MSKMPRQRNKNIALKITEHEYIRLKERINVSGLSQTQYCLQALLYGRVVVTGSRENIDYILQRIEELESKLELLIKECQQESTKENEEGLLKIKAEYVDVLKVLLEIIKEADIQVKKSPCERDKDFS